MAGNSLNPSSLIHASIGVPPQLELIKPIGMWYVLETDGLFQNQQEVDNYKNKEGKIIQPTAKPGDLRFKEQNAGWNE